MRIRHIFAVCVACAVALPLASCTLCSGDDKKEENAAARAKARARARKARRKRARQRRLEARSVTVGEAKRRYRVQRPRRAKGSPAALIMLHDNRRSDRDFTRRNDLRGGAHKLGYILAIPSATREGWGPGLCPEQPAPKPSEAAEAPKTQAEAPKTQAEAAKGTAAAKAASPATPAAAAKPPNTQGAGAKSGEAQLADLDYLKAIVEDLTGKLRADPKRIYLLGMGAGAALAQTAVSKMPGQFAGVMLVSPDDRCIDPKLAPASQPIPALLMTGPAPGAASAGQPPTPGAAPKLAGLDFWLKANQCDAKPSSKTGRVTTHEYTCQSGKVIHVQTKKPLRRWPKKVGRTYSLRYVHNFIKDASR